MKKLTFSGHETFHCRHFWLKKGYDFIKNGNSFNETEAVVELGVGKNMVSAIRFWLKAFDLVTEADEITKMAEYIFGDNGIDPYLENNSTLWLLHYFLVSKNKASIYNLIFNDFRKERIEFSKEQINSFLKRKCDEENFNYNEKTISNDINVFLKNYYRPRKKIKNVEDEFNALLIELDLIQQISKEESEGINWYKIESTEKSEIPAEIVLFSILDQNENQTSIPFYKLLNDYNNPGLIFAMNAKGLMEKINKITKMFSSVVFSDTAGIRELQIKNNFNKWHLLDKYYAN